MKRSWSVRVNEAGQELAVTRTDGTAVCLMPSYDRLGFEDAMLIASAPLLLASLKELMEVCSIYTRDNALRAALQCAYITIKKAEGAE